MAMNYFTRKENVMIHYAPFCWERGRPRPQSLRSKLKSFSRFALSADEDV
jgi:hypothetical protein